VYNLPRALWKSGASAPQSFLSLKDFACCELSTTPGVARNVVEKARHRIAHENRRMLQRTPGRFDARNGSEDELYRPGAQTRPRYAPVAAPSPRDHGGPPRGLAQAVQIFTGEPFFLFASDALIDQVFLFRDAAQGQLAPEFILTRLREVLTNYGLRVGHKVHAGASIRLKVP